MKAVATEHPSEQTLSDYVLGKLGEGPAAAVDGHLSACPECRGRIAEVPADSFLGRVRGAANTATGPYSGPPPAADTLPPGLADHADYEVKRELGRGGMGVVYLAHNRLMGRDEVLKVMGRQVVERPGVFDRFLREIRAVASLRHPNIVSAYSAFRLGEGVVFAMEHVEGLDLARVVKAKGPMPVAHACLFAHQAALGLQHAHEEGLVHRDVKPANLMLSRRGDRATIKVLDFGLAKAAREGKLDGGLTSEGQALGTPDFIAPEQILDAQSADIRADIYSLGGTLFYLLTGRPPFRANSLYDIYQAHISRDAEPLNVIRPEVPAELAALVAKMLAKDPARRFQTPGEVARALTPFFKRVAPAAPRPEVAPMAPVPTVAPPPEEIAPPTAEKKTLPSDSRWASLAEPATGSAPGPPPRGRWRRRAIIAASAAALVALLIGIVIKIRIERGRVSVEVAASDPADRFQPGATWVGTWTFETSSLAGQELPYSMTITGRSGDKFRASASFVNLAMRELHGSHVGALRGDRFESLARGTSYTRGSHASRLSFEGTVDGRILRTKFSGFFGRTNEPISGHGTLVYQGPIEPSPPGRDSPRTLAEGSERLALIGHWDHQVGDAQRDLELMADGTARTRSANDYGRGMWNLSGGDKLTIRWPNADAPGHALMHHLVLSADRKSYEGTNYLGNKVTGTRGADGGRARMPKINYDPSAPIEPDPVDDEAAFDDGLRAKVVGTWRHAVNNKPQGENDLRPDGTIWNQWGKNGSWSLSGSTLTLRWPNGAALGGEWVDSVEVTADGFRYEGSNQEGASILGLR